MTLPTSGNSGTPGIPGTPGSPDSLPATVLTLPPVPRLLKAADEATTFDAEQPVYVARAPGRLDVMGGIADYSGAAVCEMPLAVAAAAAVQLRDDELVVCRSAQAQGELRLPVRRVLDVDALAVREACDEADAWARYPLGCAWWLLRHRHGEARALQQGVTIALDSDVPLGGGVSSSAAIEVATMSALAAALDVTMTPLELAAACQAVENGVVGAPCGIMDQVTSAMGEADSLLVLLCQPDGNGRPVQVLDEALAVPAGYAFIGVHSGVAHEVKGDPYTDTRVAAFMAQKMLSDVDGEGDVTGGHLANVDPVRFERQWQALLPASLTGAAFVSDHGATNDPVTSVAIDKTYAVRAAATHHVLEAERVRRFVALLRAARAGRADEADTAMIEAGTLMLASHRSYGACAMLGHAMTDRLVEMAQAIGPQQGVYGAKITGGGCGGTVAMLVRDDPAVYERIEQLRGAYTSETARPTLLFRGSGPGAAAVGTARVSL